MGKSKSQTGVPEETPTTTEEDVMSRIENDSIVASTRVSGGHRVMHGGYRHSRQTEIEVKIAEKSITTIQNQVVDSDQNRSTTLQVFRDWLALELNLILGDDWISNPELDRGVVEATIPV